MECFPSKNEVVYFAKEKPIVKKMNIQKKDRIDTNII